MHSPSHVLRPSAEAQILEDRPAALQEPPDRVPADREPERRAFSWRASSLTVIPGRARTCSRIHAPWGSKADLSQRLILAKPTVPDLVKPRFHFPAVDSAMSKLAATARQVAPACMAAMTCVRKIGLVDSGHFGGLLIAMRASNQISAPKGIPNDSS